MKKPTKCYERIHEWEAYDKTLPIEFRQSLEEGLDIETLKPLFDAVAALPSSEAKEKLSDSLYQMVLDAPVRRDYAYEEPSDLSSILALRDGCRVSGSSPVGEVLRDKLTGAWTGRVAGCLLGKPVEGARSPDMAAFFQASGNWPVSRYIRSGDMTDALAAGNACAAMIRERGWYADRMAFSPADDDTNYTVLASRIIEDSGLDFTPADVMKAWLRYQPRDAYCTAERVAFRNFLTGYFPPDSAIYKNPYREWIGAQIRGDYFGYINPGDPERAADMAWRDASISHVKNGIYGEMFIAAATACAAVSDDAGEVLRGGLGQVPRTSRLYRCVTRILEMAEGGAPCAGIFADIHSRYDEYDAHDWCHTLSNAEIVASALLYGGSFDECIGLAVQTGFDTDCNGATAGSLYGMMHGSGCIAAQWTEPIGSAVDTALVGVGTVKVDALVELMMKHIGTK